MNMLISDHSSFRDPAGSIFWIDGAVYRQVNSSYKKNFELLIHSGLYQALLKRDWLVEHEEVDGPMFDPENLFKVLKPSLIDFISYPYEWSFSQLKEAALLTLDIQQLAIEHGMSLKDASAYNIQFTHGKPVLIDTLSFELYEEGKPWVAYRQFCQHFLAPLALMAKSDIRLSQLSKVFIDGVPLDMASSLLPLKTWLQWGLMSHIHLHARVQKAYANSSGDSKFDRHSSTLKLSRNGLLGIVDSLRKTIESLKWSPVGTEWASYYNATNYSDASLIKKRDLVAEFIDYANPKKLWDLGANTGFFTRVAAERNIPSVAFDVDPAAVDICYKEIRASGEGCMLPLVLDLTNPSPSIGWASKERGGLASRGPVDCIMALALIHHLTISNNVPFSMIAEFFSEIGAWLIIEFVPKSDSQVKRLLQTREDVFINYHQEAFETDFTKIFSIVKKKSIPGSHRVLYLMKKIC